MPDHIHVLLTPTTNLEKAVQFIKGGFSYRAKKELGSEYGSLAEGVFGIIVFVTPDDYQHVEYIRRNPVRKKSLRAAGRNIRIRSGKSGLS